jgi:hypothetical protein
MGFKFSYNGITDAAREINAAAYDACNPGNDGFIAWGAKQDLYRLKWILENALKRCPNFAPEEEWLREQEKKKVIGILKNDSHSR